MKIGILSMQRIQNFGSLLQAYALKNMLEKNGNEVSFIDIKYIEEDNGLLDGHQLDFSNEREKSGKKQVKSKLNKYFINRVKNLLRLKKQNALFEKFRSNFLFTNEPNSYYDMAVIGSDEVFNCMNSGYWGYTSQLFGNIPEAKKVVTYAASCGSTTFNSVPKKVKNSIQSAMSNIQLMSVRDENTLDFVSHFYNRKIVKNLDPVLVYDFSQEVDRAKIPKVRNRYCIIYSYGNRIHEKNEIDAIMRFCEENNLEPITVGGPQFWVKKHILCSPFECLKLFSEADFVITDTFHGTIFSIKYAQKFAVIIRDSNRNKLNDLISTLKCREHVVDEMSDLDNIYKVRKDNDEINRILNSEYNHSLNYLKECQKLNDE